MFKFLRPSTVILLVIMTFVFVMSCKKKSEVKDETVLTGTTTIYVDETLFPIIEDEVAVFESQYKAKINLIAKPETEIINILIKRKGEIAILAKTLNDSEKVYSNSKILPPIVTQFGSDGVVFIAGKNHKDSIVDLKDIYSLIKGNTSKIKGLVFDNPNSSTVRYLDSIAGVKIASSKLIYSLRSQEEVIKFISNNDNNYIGVIGLNTLVQPTVEMMQYSEKIKVLGVVNVKNGLGKNNVYKPNQSNISGGLYPLTRKMYMLNYQGKEGLGMGFASFIAGDIGQRIILKSGLVPIRIPTRKVLITNKMENNNK